MTEKQIFKEIITGYREVIQQRYQYQNLKDKYDLPNSFDQEKVALFRNYFLDYIYPDFEKREALNDAFESLDGYIKNPQKLLRLVLDSGRLIFKYGRHLPNIAKAGLRALKSFLTANQFEKKLITIAREEQLKAPYGKAEIDFLLKSLPKEEIEAFINSSQVLFETLYDRPLVKKIIEIVQYLIAQMKKHPSVYSAEEIQGLEIGFDIIREGNALFEQLPEKDQKRIFEFIIEIEKGVLEELY